MYTFAELQDSIWCQVRYVCRTVGALYCYVIYYKQIAHRSKYAVNMFVSPLTP